MDQNSDHVPQKLRTVRKSTALARLNFVFLFFTVAF